MDNNWGYPCFRTPTYDSSPAMSCQDSKSGQFQAVGQIVTEPLVEAHHICASSNGPLSFFTNMDWNGC